MDERRIKRLVVMLVMAIVVIMLAKYMLTKAVTNVGTAAMEKKRAAATQQTNTPAADVIPPDTSVFSAASAVADGEGASSPVTSTNQ